ncbi:hypothetical protein MXF26_07420 [Pantoea dispersa]|uniref:hypothetical protein n=1 Tax=Pantoea dispersa TaxID=59814 RepID=UPI002DB61528|nr:hypothetical protein [Pantoea dispersa]MEB5836087.1 hypothetical protein [Pantoea dispersa]
MAEQLPQNAREEQWPIGLRNPTKRQAQGFMIGLLRQQKQIAPYACHTRPRLNPHGYFRADRCLSAGNLTQRFREFDRDATTVHLASKPKKFF